MSPAKKLLLGTAAFSLAAIGIGFVAASIEPVTDSDPHADSPATSSHRSPPPTVPMPRLAPPHGPTDA